MIKFEIYDINADLPHNSAEWYWHAKTKNGRIVADGSEGYYKLGNAKRAVNHFVELLGATNFEIVVLD